MPSESSAAQTQGTGVGPEPHTLGTRGLTAGAEHVKSAATPSPDLSGNASIAAKQLEEHLATESLGGGHPLMVVVPRDALLTLLDGYRRYLGAAVKHSIEEEHRRVR